MSPYFSGGVWESNPPFAFGETLILKTRKPTRTHSPPKIRQLGTGSRELFNGSFTPVASSLFPVAFLLLFPVACCLFTVIKHKLYFLHKRVRRYIAVAEFFRKFLSRQLLSVRP